MKICPICNRRSLNLNIEFKLSGKQILKYSCNNCDYYKQEVVDYLTAQIRLRSMYARTGGYYSYE